MHPEADKKDKVNDVAKKGVEVVFQPCMRLPQPTDSTNSGKSGDHTDVIKRAQIYIGVSVWRAPENRIFA
jgi:hypothetical protein